MHRSHSTGALFLGPKAENGNLFKSMAMQAFDNHFQFRENLFPCDPLFVTDEMRQTQSFQDMLDKTREELHKMHKELEGSVPFFSPRYKGHVNWDTLMSANLAYMSAMMYNQNNCATEGSPVTSQYEVEVGRDLCTMIGYDPNKSMGHLVAGGSVANVEAIWAARNLKFYPIGLSDAIKNEDALMRAREIKVFIPQKNQRVYIVRATTWDLLNLDVDEIMELPLQVADACGMSPSTLSEMLNDYMYESIGPFEFHRRHSLLKSPCCLVASSAHVSFCKGNTILGLGKKHLIRVPLDENARMDPKVLSDLLKDKLANQIPVISVICIMGTTEESAVDPLTDMLTIRSDMRKKGLNFSIHADGAWGGYFCSMLCTPTQPLETDNDSYPWFVPGLPLSSYTHTQLSAIQHADTVTIDPHKSGFCPYPGGAICYRDRRINNFLAVNSAVTYYHGDVKLGNVGIEGSKPGAAAAGIVMAHRVVGLHQNGYGRILAECMFTSKLLYCMWVCLARDDDPFFVVPTKPLPPDKTREEHIRFMRRNILGKTNAAIAKNKEAMEYLREIGPDTLIPCFTWNLKGNSDVDLVNKMVEVVLQDLCMSRDKQGSSRLPIVITASTHNYDHRSPALTRLKKRLRLDPDDTTGVRYVITSCMDPQIAATGGLLNELATNMRMAILNAIGTVTNPKVQHDFITAGLLPTSHVVAYYASQFTQSSTQYCAVVKMEFCSSMDKVVALNCGTEPVVIRCVSSNTLHDLLLSALEVDCYLGMPGGGKTPFLRTTVRVVDVPRFDRFDPTASRYPDSSKYFMYGLDDKVYIMHIPTKQPDFLQLVELVSIPGGVTSVLIEHGIEVYLPLDGSPKMREGHIMDPLDRYEYKVEYTGQNGCPSQTTITIGRKLWFDGNLINGFTKKPRPKMRRSTSYEVAPSLHQLTMVGMRRRLCSMSELPSNHEANMRQHAVQCPI